MIENFKYTETELKKILKSLVVLIDTREQVNEHITKWFDENGISHKSKKLEYGDYAFYLPQNPEMGILRDMYFTEQICIERKGSIDEIIGNFANDRNRIEDEFLRHQGLMTLIIEDGCYNDIRSGNYRSKYESKSAIGTLHSFSQRYNIPFVFLNKEDTGCFIYCTFYYFLRNQLK